MREEQKTVVLSLTPGEYIRRSKLIAEYILDQHLDGNWISTGRKHLRGSFDANYNLYYIKLKFDKATF